MSERTHTGRVLMWDHGLTEAYHTLWDIKNQYLESDTLRVQCYNAITSLRALMDSFGIPVPERSDGVPR